MDSLFFDSVSVLPGIKTGKKSEGTSKNGKRNDRDTAWYENGNIKYEIYYKDRQPDGLVIEWSEDGKKTYEGVFKKGEVEMKPGD